jgi:hypothetical protein
MEKCVIDIEESAGCKSQLLLHVYIDLNFGLKVDKNVNERKYFILPLESANFLNNYIFLKFPCWVFKSFLVEKLDEIICLKKEKIVITYLYDKKTFWDF